MSRTFNIFSRINAWTKISYVPENSDANWQRHTLKSSFPVREPGCILMVRMDWMTRKDKRDSYAKDGSKEGHGGRTEPQPPWIECDVNGMGNLPVLHKDWWKGQWNPWNAESHKGDRLPRLHPPDVEMLAIAVRRHWHIENGLSNSLFKCASFWPSPTFFHTKFLKNATKNRETDLNHQLFPCLMAAI